MAASCLTPSSASSLLKHTTKPTIPEPFQPSRRFPPPSIHFPYPKLSTNFALFISSQCPNSKNRTGFFKISAVVDGERWLADEEINGEENFEGENESSDFPEQHLKPSQSRPCELYVCNLPRSFDSPQLLDLFQRYGTVLSVEVSKNPETGTSRGCGYVAMSSIDSAKSAIAALDGSDVDGREMRVRYSVEMKTSTRNPELLNSAPKKNMIYESPYKIYVGNLPWATKPGDLRNIFSQYGTVVSTRIVQDRKGGKTRVYGFLSFSSAAERDASVALNGTDFCGRTLVVREGVEKVES